MPLEAVQGNCWDVGLGGNGGVQRKGGGGEAVCKTTIKTERAVGAGHGTAQMWINQSVSPQW